VPICGSPLVAKFMHGRPQENENDQPVICLCAVVAQSSIRSNISFATWSVWFVSTFVSDVLCAKEAEAQAEAPKEADVQAEAPAEEPKEADMQAEAGLVCVVSLCRRSFAQNMHMLSTIMFTTAHSLRNITPSGFCSHGDQVVVKLGGFHG
jgi:hypothetical protein